MPVGHGWLVAPAGHLQRGPDSAAGHSIQLGMVSQHFASDSVTLCRVRLGRGGL